MDQKLEVVIIDTPEPQTNPNPKTLLSRAKDSILTPLLRNSHIGHFRISLSLSAQALLWKTLIHSTNQSHHLLPSTALLLLWSLALFTFSATCLVYALKSLLHFDAVKKEFLHHISVNYFFTPSTTSLLLLHSSPFEAIVKSHGVLTWCLFVFPTVVLDVKIYGQWFTKGKRTFLSKVASPASQMSVIANLVAARASVEMMGWGEVALGLFALGMVHYLVLFVTLYQRLPGGEGLPVNLRPVFFLFVATPSMASLAWRSINGRFDSAAKMLFFLSLFLFVSLICRPGLFKKAMKKFSVAWWAYAFSITLLTLAAYEYAEEVQATPAHVMMLVLSILTMLVLFVLLVFTVKNANKLLFGSEVDLDRSGSGSSSSLSR